MAEPKGGPVKPPVLDLKPARSDTTRTKPDRKGPKKTQYTGTRQSSARAKPATTSPAKTRSRTPSGTKPSSHTQTATSSRAPGPASTSRSKDTPHPRAPTSNKTIPTSEKSFLDSSPLEKTETERQNRKFSGIQAILGGVILSLVILAPLIVSGVIRSPQSARSVEQFTALSDRQTRSEEQIGEALVGFRAINEQFSRLQEENLSSREKLQTQFNDLNARLAGLETRQSRILAAQAQTGQELEALSITQRELKASVSLSNQSAPDLPVPFDLSPLQQKIAALESRLDALFAGASSQDATRLAGDISSLQTGLEQATATLNQFGATSSSRDEKIEKTLDDLAVRISDLENQVTSAMAASVSSKLLADQMDRKLKELSASLEGTQIRRTRQESIRQFQEVPALLSQIEAKIERGKTFFTELEGLKALLPELEISDQLARIATSGLPSPANLAADFNLAIPAMLGARPIKTDAPFTRRISEMLQSILAIRPIAENTGDAIQNQIRQAEQAVSAGDFATASQSIHALPQPMQDALGETGTQIDMMAQFKDLIHQTRLSQARLLPLQEDNPQENKPEENSILTPETDSQDSQNGPASPPDSNQPPPISQITGQENGHTQTSQPLGSASEATQ